MTEGASLEAESGAGQEGSATRRLARTYAEALLNAAEKQDQAEEIGAELDSLVREVFQAEPKIEALFASPVIKRSRKEPILRQAFEGKASDLFFDFLMVLNRHDRLGLLREVAAGYRELRDIRAKRVRVLVRTAVPMQEDQQRSLEALLSQSLKLEPILQVHVDPDLLGGMIVQVGDEVFDSSVRTRIDTLRNQLLARSSYEIQSQRNRSGS